MLEIIKTYDYHKLFSPEVYAELNRLLFLSARKNLGTQFTKAEGIFISKNIQTNKGIYSIFIEYIASKITFVFSPPDLNVDIKTCYLFDEINDFLLDKICELKRRKERD